MCCHALEKLLRPIRLAHKIVYPRRQNSVPLLVENARRNSRDFYVLPARQTSDPGGDFHSAHAWQLNVQPNEMWMPPGKYIDASQAFCGRPNLKSGALQDLLNQQSVGFIVFDN